MICRGCLEDKQEDSFPLRRDCIRPKRRPYCYECAKNISKKRYDSYKRESPFKHKVTRIRSRSQSLKVPFDLDREYLEEIWTGICPVYKIPIYMESERGKPNSAELDRIIPDRGYVKGNVEFISRKANNHKNNMSFYEVSQLYKHMEKRFGARPD